MLWPGLNEHEHCTLWAVQKLNHVSCVMSGAFSEHLPLARRAHLAGVNLRICKYKIFFCFARLLTKPNAKVIYWQAQRFHTHPVTWNQTFKQCINRNEASSRYHQTGAERAKKTFHFTSCRLFCVGFCYRALDWGRHSQFQPKWKRKIKTNCIRN